jgi:hypothetical protein
MGHLLKINCAHSPLNLCILSSTCVPFTLTTVQVPNLALTHKERITVRPPLNSQPYSSMTDQCGLLSVVIKFYQIIKRCSVRLRCQEKNKRCSVNMDSKNTNLSAESLFASSLSVEPLRSVFSMKK